MEKESELATVRVVKWVQRMEYQQSEVGRLCETDELFAWSERVKSDRWRTDVWKHEFEEVVIIIIIVVIVIIERLVNRLTDRNQISWRNDAKINYKSQ